MNQHNLRYELIDVCLPDYLQDHHQRANEQLIAIAYQEQMSYRELAHEVATEVLYGGASYEELWSVLPSDDEEARSLIECLVIDAVGDWQLDNEKMHNELTVYGVFTWDSDEDDVL